MPDDNLADEEDLQEYAEKVEEEFLQEGISAESIAQAVGDAAKVKSHLERDIKDQCAYCGQHFPPDENVIEKELYGRIWRFCSEECLDDFREKSNFRDQNLDGTDPEVVVNITKEDES